MAPARPRRSRMQEKAADNAERAKSGTPTVAKAKKSYRCPDIAIAAMYTTKNVDAAATRNRRAMGSGLVGSDVLAEPDLMTPNTYSTPETGRCA